MKLQMDDLSNFLGKSFFGDDGFRNIFVYQPTLDTSEIKKKIRVLIMILVRNQTEYLPLNLSNYIILSYIA